MSSSRQSTSNTAPYDITEHRHRFAVWAAARAAQRGFTGATNVVLKQAIEECGIVEFLKHANWDSVSEQGFADKHRKWCRAASSSLKGAGVPNPTFGRAAKLIAVYTKSVVVCGSGPSSELARVAHPPIDRILLQALSASPDIDSPHKKYWRSVAWTQLTERPLHRVEVYMMIKRRAEAAGLNVSRSRLLLTS